jgi:hypothetical protein
MSKRTPSKHSRSPKKAAKAQRAPSNRRKRSLEANSSRPPTKDNEPKQEPLLIENPVRALEGGFKESMTDIESDKMPVSSSLPANVRGYQAMLLEMAQANMQFSFEFAQRLATIRSPIEFLNVITESTNKRIAMFEKHSKEMAGFLALRRA